MKNKLKDWMKSAHRKKKKSLIIKSLMLTKVAFTTSDQKYSKNSNIVKYYYNLK